MGFPSCCKRHMVTLPHEGACVSTFTMMFGSYSRLDPEDPEGEEVTPPAEYCGPDYHILVRVAVGKTNTQEGHTPRRKVRMSAWTAPTPQDGNDKTHVGMLIDENNEMEIELNEITFFHLKGLLVPESGLPRGVSHRIISPAITFFVEWSAMNPHSVVFIPTLQTPLAYMQLREVNCEMSSPYREEQNVKNNLLVNPYPYPERPADRPPPPPPPGPNPNPKAKRQKRATRAARADEQAALHEA